MRGSQWMYSHMDRKNKIAASTSLTANYLRMFGDIMWTHRCRTAWDLAPLSLLWSDQIIQYRSRECYPIASGMSLQPVQRLHVFQSVQNVFPRLQITACYWEPHAVISCTEQHFNNTACFILHLVIFSVCICWGKNTNWMTSLRCKWSV